MITFSAAFCETVSELKDSIRAEERQLRRLKEGVLLTQVKSGKKLSHFYGCPGRLLLYFLLFSTPLSQAPPTIQTFTRKTAQSWWNHWCQWSHWAPDDINPCDRHSCSINFEIFTIILFFQDILRDPSLVSIINPCVLEKIFEASKTKGWHASISRIKGFREIENNG